MHTRALIIGTGFSGLGMGIELQRQGVEFLILEKADEIGGTWRDNTYPGLRVRHPVAHVLVLVRAQARLEHMWSFQPEILDYLQGVTDKYGLRRYIRFDSHVDRAHWDDDEMQLARVHQRRAASSSRSSSSPGPAALHIPADPDFEGLDDFRGAPLSIPRSGTTTSTSPASGWR